MNKKMWFKQKMRNWKRSKGIKRRMSRLQPEK